MRKHRACRRSVEFRAGRLRHPVVPFIVRVYIRAGNKFRHQGIRHWLRLRDLACKLSPYFKLEENPVIFPLIVRVVPTFLRSMPG